MTEPSAPLIPELLDGPWSSSATASPVHRPGPVPGHAEHRVIAGGLRQPHRRWTLAHRTIRRPCRSRRPLREVVPLAAPRTTRRTAIMEPADGAPPCARTGLLEIAQGEMGMGLHRDDVDARYGDILAACDARRRPLWAPGASRRRGPGPGSDRRSRDARHARRGAASTGSSTARRCGATWTSCRRTMDRYAVAHDGVFKVVLLTCSTCRVERFGCGRWISRAITVWEIPRPVGRPARAQLTGHSRAPRRGGTGGTGRKRSRSWRALWVVRV
jgi:hypothetical protein